MGFGKAVVQYRKQTLRPDCVHWLLINGTENHRQPLKNTGLCSTEWLVPLLHWTSVSTGKKKNLHKIALFSSLKSVGQKVLFYITSESSLSLATRLMTCLCPVYIYFKMDLNGGWASPSNELNKNIWFFNNQKIQKEW